MSQNVSNTKSTLYYLHNFTLAHRLFLTKHVTEYSVIIDDKMKVE